ncbi:tetratricopeptide repeat protein [Desulfococcaceae bacterium HSG8]|nr:tetratricopeptide repeat protein [Desulfococcaceae bacterium HSG8]
MTSKETIFNIRCDLLIALFLVFSTFAVYWQMRNHEFVTYDDKDYIIENKYVRTGLNPESITWAFRAAHAANWHPLTWLSHMADIQLYGMNPGQHHLTSLLFHIANTLLLFAVFRRMTGKMWQSGFVAALFALHPLHAESVAWAAERKDVLSTFFWMITLWYYIRYAETPGVRTYLPVILFFTLGLMSKPMVVTLPFVLLLLDYWPLKRISWSREQGTEGRGAGFLILEKIPLFALSAALSVITFFVQQSGGAVKSADIYPLEIRISNALISYISYLGKMIWPDNLSCIYPHPLTFPWWQVAVACVLFLSMSAWMLRMAKHRPYCAVGWLWYIGTLVPVIGLVQIGGQAMADRYTYIPLIGIFIIIAWGIPELLGERPYKKIFLAAAVTILLPILMMTAWIQVRYWRNSITLFEHVLDITENNYLAHNNLGIALANQGRTDEAAEHYAEALRINPDYAFSHNNLAILLAIRGKTAEASRHLSQALRAYPGYAEAHYNMGRILSDMGKTDEAIRHYLMALHLSPDDADIYNNLGAALLEKGKRKEAIAHFQKALQINPYHSIAYKNLRHLSGVRK